MSKTLPPLQPGTPEQNALWDHVYEYGHAAEGVHGFLEKVCQAYARAAIEKDRERQSAPAFDSVRLTRFLTDVVTAAGLLSHGKQSKAVAERVAKEACVIRAMLAAAPQPKPVQEPVTAIGTVISYLSNDGRTKWAFQPEAAAWLVPRDQRAAERGAESCFSVYTSPQAQPLIEVLTELESMYDKADQITPLHKGMRMAISTACDRVNAVMKKHGIKGTT